MVGRSDQNLVAILSDMINLIAPRNHLIPSGARPPCLPPTRKIITNLLKREPCCRWHEQKYQHNHGR